MKNETLLENALRYAELGYPVFPCVPNGKRPLTANGLLDATTDAAQIETWWTAHPSANVAIVTAGLLVVDLDTAADGSANDWLANDPDKLIDLAAGALSLTPRGGRHYIFRQPTGIAFRNTAGKLAKGVDTRADGGYILVPPSVVEGKPYRWAGEAQLSDTPRDSLAEPPTWLVALLDGTAGNLASDRAEQAAPSNQIPDGQRNSTLASLAGTMRRAGMSEAEILAALHKANVDRCKPPLPDDEIETIAWSVARYEPDQVSVAVVEGHFAQDFGNDPDLANSAPSDPGDFPQRLLAVPGFIGDVIDFSLGGAFRPQPVLSLAGALCLLATLTGRKVTDTVGTRTNLYCIGVGETACGKDRARVVNKEILHLAGLDEMIGPESIGSSAGLVSVIEENPAILLQLDEIGRYLRTLGDAKQSHLFNIITVLMKLFTSSSSIYVGDAYADTKRIKTIFQPHLCVYGTTVPQSLLESLTLESLTDGFLSRCLIFEGSDVERQAPSITAVPDRIVKQAEWWGRFSPGGNMSGKTPQPITVTTTADADARFSDLERSSDAEHKRLGNPLGPLWSRSGEKARKLGLLWGCSIDPHQPLIDLKAAEWAASTVDYLTRRIIYLASRWVSSSGYEAKVKRILRLIESAGPAGVTKTKLNNYSGLPMRERSEIIADLMSRGAACPIERLENPAAKRPTTRYVASRFLAQSSNN